MRDGAANTGRTRARALARRGVWLLVVPLALTVALIAGHGRQSFASDPVALNGSWAPFTRCPVDDPAMLAVDGSTQSSTCVASISTGGSFKLGNTETTTGTSELQFGIISAPDGTSAGVSPPGGAIVAAPVDVPGGLLGLMCPSADPVVASVCALVTTNALNTVTATVESAGTPSNVNLAAGALLGVPIMTLPIKVHLENPLLGSTCFIGSDTDPITLSTEYGYLRRQA